MNIYLLLFINVCGAQCNEERTWRQRVTCTSCPLQVGDCSAKKMNKNGFSIGIVNTDEEESEKTKRVFFLYFMEQCGEKTGVRSSQQLLCE